MATKRNLAAMQAKDGMLKEALSTNAVTNAQDDIQKYLKEPTTEAGETFLCLAALRGGTFKEKKPDVIDEMLEKEEKDKFANSVTRYVHLAVFFIIELLFDLKDSRYDMIILTALKQKGDTGVKEIRSIFYFAFAVRPSDKLPSKFKSITRLALTKRGENLKRGSNNSEEGKWITLLATGLADGT
jgi:hypothetical protein